MAQQKAKHVGRPTEVKVLTVTYEVQYLCEDEWYAKRCDPEAIGMTERDKALVLLRADGTADEDALRATLLHELLHCCTQSSRFDNYLKEVNDPEELFVALVSPVLMAVLHENPGVLAYLLSSGPIQ